MDSQTTSLRNPEDRPRVLISVVSHGQGRLVEGLLGDIMAHWSHAGLRLVLTQNLRETVPRALDELPFPVWVTRNPYPQGFGANHNAAFRVFGSDVFCLVNPDIRCPEDPMPALVDALWQPGAGLAAPRVEAPDGGLEDSARRCITPMRILSRAIGLSRNPDYAVADEPLYPDWVAGMFMALRSEVFAELEGFDERYRLYCEDADLCMRVWNSRRRVVLVPRARVVHDARRASHHQWRHLQWHLASLLRFFIRYPFYGPFRNPDARATEAICRHP